MDTPGRRTTRSQMSTLGPSSGTKPPGSRGAGSAKKNELPRPPFTDLTNDSPVSGLMPGKLAANGGCVYESTPRSKLRPSDRPIGEDLLRMQVTALLKRVEAEAVLQNKKPPPTTPNLFESPMRLAAPTPANTPAAGMPGAQDTKATILPPIVVASPVCPMDISNLERISPAFVSTAELLSSIEETCPVEQPTTRTLKFDSPDKQVLAIDRESVATPSSVSTGEILASIEETYMSLEPNVVDELTTRVLQFESPAKQDLTAESQSGSRTLQFDSPQKSVPDAENFIELFSPSAHPHARITAATEDNEDSWSVIVNVNSPEKLEADGDSGQQLVDVPTTSEVNVETMEFLQSVLVDPEISPPRGAIPTAVWERRDTPAVKSGLRDDEDFEDCEEFEDLEAQIRWDEEEEEEEEAYEDGTDTLDADCEELCKGLSTINMGCSKPLPAYEGKHTRFTYNSDDEIEEEVVVLDKRVNSPSKVRLQGLPTPKGKHIRFSDEVGADQDE